MWQQWVNLIAGIWLIISPAVIKSSSLSTSTVITGIVIGIMALWGALSYTAGNKTRGSSAYSQ